MSSDAGRTIQSVTGMPQDLSFLCAGAARLMASQGADCTRGFAMKAGPEGGIDPTSLVLGWNGSGSPRFAAFCEEFVVAPEGLPNHGALSAIRTRIQSKYVRRVRLISYLTQKLRLNVL